MADNKCPICGEEFSDLRAFEDHEREHHGDQGNAARPLAEQRAREPGPGGAPGGNPVVDTRTGEVEPL